MNVNWQNWAVAIGLSMGVLLLWQSFVIDPMMEQDRTRQAEQAMQDGARPDGTLPDAAAVSGLSQYELLTGMGQRYDRHWA